MRRGRLRPAVGVAFADVADARRNIELKARDLDPARSLAVCGSLGAEDRGEIWQCDTYFTVPTGRLKLREERPGDAHLIQYERADRPEQRESRYRIAPVADPETMLEVLRASLPVRVAVTKRRRLFIHGRVRIHLDDVEELGHFVELEAVAATESDLRAERRRITELRGALGIDDERLEAMGYADQLELARVDTGSQRS